ncbi:MAG: BlaI/MecI/CopY family transcriptional regulator [Acidobacteriota bacterium]
MKTNQETLSRREREIMDILFRTGAATAQEVLDAMGDPPSYSAVRATLHVLETKGHARHRQDGTRYVYEPTQSRERARRSALDHVVKTFFDGSAEGLVASLLESRHGMSHDELSRLSTLIAKARKEGR